MRDKVPPKKFASSLVSSDCIVLRENVLIGVCLLSLLPSAALYEGFTCGENVVDALRVLIWRESGLIGGTTSATSSWCS